MNKTHQTLDINSAGDKRKLLIFWMESAEPEPIQFWMEDHLKSREFTEYLKNRCENEISL